MIKETYLIQQFQPVEWGGLEGEDEEPSRRQPDLPLHQTNRNPRQHSQLKQHAPDEDPALGEVIRDPAGHRSNEDKGQGHEPGCDEIVVGEPLVLPTFCR